MPADMIELTVTVTADADAIPAEADTDVMHPLWDKCEDLSRDIERAVRREVGASGLARELDLEVEVRGAF